MERLILVFKFAKITPSPPGWGEREREREGGGGGGGGVKLDHITIKSGNTFVNGCSCLCIEMPLTEERTE